jgi:hypothetical protein
MACNNGSYTNPNRNIILRSLLTGETSGGQWTLQSSPIGFPLNLVVNTVSQLITNSTTLLNGTDNPTVNLNDMCPGIYTFQYLIPASGSCAQVSQTTSVTVYDEPCVSILIPDTTICNICTVPQSLPVLSTTVSSSCTTGLPPTTTYQWSASTDNVVYNNLIGATNSTLTISSLSADTWYKVTATANSCSTFDIVKLTLGTNICAGIAVPLTTCTFPLTLDLFGQLLTETTGGTWTLLSGTSGNVTGLPSSTVTISNTGVYVFTYTVTSGLCSDAENVTITINSLPSAGTPVPTTTCN